MSKKVRLGLDKDVFDILDLWAKTVLSWSYDSSHGRAKDYVKRLLKRGTAKQLLLRAVRNYSQYCDSLQRSQKYRLFAGNFFSPVGMGWEQFGDPDWIAPEPLAKPAPKLLDCHVCGQRGYFPHAPGGDSGRVSLCHNGRCSNYGKPCEDATHDV